MVAATPLHLWGAVGDPQHRRRIRSIDVGIKEANLQALSGQSTGEIDGNRAFADPPLAAADGNHVLHPGNRLAFRHLAMAGLADAAMLMAAWLLGRGADLDLHVINALELEQLLPALLHNPLALALGEAGKVEPEDGPGRTHPDPIDPSQIQGGTAAAGINNLC